MNGKVISVTVIVFADGTTHWFKNKPVYKNKTDPNLEYVNACMSEWKNENEELIKTHPVQNAVCSIRMTEESYQNIKADDRLMNSMDRGQSP